MLQFIYGKPSSGKTTFIIDKIKELSENGHESVLIVPEQFTFESEHLILKKLGDSVFANTSVLSFSRIYDEVSRNVGGNASIILNDANKVIIMYRVLNEISGELKVWSKFCKSIKFAKTIIDTISEFKINAYTYQDIYDVSLKTESKSLSAKLYDLSIILKKYDIYLGQKFIDPDDILTKLYYKLLDYNFFEGKTVFLDSFKGFTRQQYKIIERIISQATNVFISFTNNINIKNELNIFTNVRTTIEKIAKIAKTHNVQIAEPEILEETFFKGCELTQIEKIISGDLLSESIEKDKSVIIAKASNPFDEADFVAQSIRRLVRSKNYRYRDFVIIARDADYYKYPVISACKKNEINLFYDKRIPLSAFPFAIAVEAAIKALAFSTSDILRFHKTGLGLLNINEISLLENYTYLWNIDGEHWLSNWNMDPRGMTINQKENDEIKDKLKEINQLREKAISPILNLKNEFHSNTSNMVIALINLFKTCYFSEKLSAISDKLNFHPNNFTFETMKTAYDEYMNILDSLVHCLGDENISVSEFLDALKLTVSLSSIGTIPQMLDEVAFGSADRIRPSRPKIAFILGANQGVFPKINNNTGVFNLIERKSLIEHGLNISDNSLYSSIDEDFLVYSNVCCPSEKIYISYSMQTVSFEELQPSAFLRNIISKLNMEVINISFDDFNSLNLPETAKTAFSEFCKSRQSNPLKAQTIAAALYDTAERNKVQTVEKMILSNDKRLTPEVAQKLYGNNITLSASRFDLYNRCKFSYFCRYGLGAKKLQPAQFDIMQRGTIVHYVLEKLITLHKNEISNFSNDELDNLTEKYINLYLDSILGYRACETSRMRFLVGRITRSLKEVVKHIAKEISQSDFKPIACELSIGSKDSSIHVQFPAENGKISLVGSIDRVDEYNGYIRIIDYKTGSKSFKMPDILFGLNLQMLIYLYAVIRGQNFSDDNAAGVLYQPSKRDIKNKGMAMNGIIRLDNDLIYAMDKTNAGEFVPKLSLKADGTLSKNNNSFIQGDDFTEIFDYIELLIKKVGNDILSGDISVSPIDGRESPACKYCDFHSICGFGNKIPNKVPDYSNNEVIDFIKEAKTNGICTDNRTIESH